MLKIFSCFLQYPNVILMFFYNRSDESTKNIQHDNQNESVMDIQHESTMDIQHHNSPTKSIFGISQTR